MPKSPRKTSSAKKAANRRVSRKISLLRGEGKPQAQAVAQAINMTGTKAQKGRGRTRRT